MPLIRRLVLAIFLLLLVPALALAAPVRHKLPGNLTVITAENHEAPVVAFQVWVRAGSAYERATERGITHFIEHMIFKGTPTVPVGAMARLIEALGGEINAYTTLDHTNYYVVAASHNAYRALALLADSVVNASYGQGEMTREKEVVVEEIRMNKNSPTRRFIKAVLAQSFGDHPYGRPVLGTVKSVRGFSRADILKYVKRWYRRPGVVVVAVGDFNTKKLLPKIQKAFANLPAGNPPAFSLPPVKVGPGPRLKVLKEKVRQARISFSWRIPGLPHPDTYPLEVAAAVGGDGETSRLYLNLKEKRRLVDSIGIWSYTPAKIGLLQVQATMAPGKLAKAWPEILKELARLISTPPDKAELKRARVQLAASFIRSRQTMAGQARILGSFEFFHGGFEKIPAYLKHFNAVSGRQAAAALARYLTPANMTVLIQAPAGTPVPTLAQLKAAAAKFLPPAVKVPARAEKAGPAVALKTPASKAKPGGKVLTIKKVFKNGLTLIVRPVRHLPLVSYVLAVRGGRVNETPKTSGLYTLWSSSLTRGSKNHTYEELARKLEDMAGSLAAFAGTETAGIGGSFLAADWRVGLDLLAEVWFTPTFPAPQVARAKAEQLAGLRRQEDSPVSRAFLRFKKLMYGNHPYGFNSLGAKENVTRLTRKQLLKAHRAVMGPGGAVLTVVGDIDAKKVVAQVRKLFAGRKGKVTLAKVAPPATPKKSRHEDVNELAAQQTQVIMGFPAPSLHSADRFAASVLRAILGGMGGRLFTNLREKQSLAYSVSPFYSARDLAGVFGFYLGVGPGKERAAMAGLAREIKHAVAKAPSAAELARAKGYIVGSYAIGLQSYGSQAAAMANGVLLGRGWDYYRRYPGFIRKVTRAQVRRVARAILNKNRESSVLSGPLNRAK